MLRTENLTHRYGVGTPFELAAISNVNITAEEGDFIGIIGHTGSGKSTLVQHLNGLLRPTSGGVYFKEKNIWEAPLNVRDIRFSIGLVFQYPEYQLFEETVYKDIAFGPKNQGLSESEIDERVRGALEFVGLDEALLFKSPFELSGGQKRRVAIAGVISMRPDVLILDEPTAGLDPRGRLSIMRRIKNYHEKQKGCVIFVSHTMEDIAQNANKVIVMNKGEVLVSGGIDEVFREYEKLRTAGVDVPQVTKVFHELKSRGVCQRADIYTLEQAKAYVLGLYRGSEV